MVMDLDEFEERFLPTSSTRATRTQDLTTGFVSNIQTLLSGNGESRMDIKEDIGSIVVSLTILHHGRTCLRTRLYSSQRSMTTTSRMAIAPEDTTTRAGPGTLPTTQPSHCSILKSILPAPARNARTGAACR